VVQGPPTRIYRYVFALVGGALLVSGRGLARVVLAVVSLLLIYAAHRAGRGHDGLP
jgi:hypothetical protein